MVDFALIEADGSHDVFRLAAFCHRRGAQDTDFDRALGMKDQEEPGMFELGWQFGKKWGLTTQYSESQRSSRSTVRDGIEWEDV